MNEYWVIPVNGKWVHVKADSYEIGSNTVEFKKDGDVAGVFFINNITGISHYEGKKETDLPPPPFI